MRNISIILILPVLSACIVFRLSEPTSTPLPGWRDLVSCLLLDDEAFPSGWARNRDWPKNSLTDPTINHVYRSWWGKKQGYGIVEQHIWRGYSITSAQEFFQELRDNQFDPKRTPPPEMGQIYIPYKPPGSIDLSKIDADEFYVACGWSGFPRCVAIARYRNYDVEIITDWETIDPIDGTMTEGLPIEEIEKILIAVDDKITNILATGHYQCDD